MSVVVGKLDSRKRKGRNFLIHVDSVKNLSNLLKNLGVKTTSHGFHLSWGIPDENQFDFLLKLMSQLINTNLHGSYKSGEWIISS